MAIETATVTLRAPTASVEQTNEKEISAGEKAELSNHSILSNQRLSSEQCEKDEEHL